MRKKKQSGAEDVIEIVSKFHWGIGVILAIASFLILHWYAGREVTVVAGMENLSKNTANSMFHVFASFGQIVLPGLFGIGAAISFFNRIKSSPRNKTKVEKQNSTVPICPKCGSKMVKRVAKKGKKAGEEFWGCSDFPRCRSVLPYR
ncbi:MAG: ribosomal protein L37AE/L43A [Desulforhopalus sp.]|jgi:ribosomal protein L37AE/L43A